MQRVLLAAQKKATVQCNGGLFIQAAQCG